MTTFDGAGKIRTGTTVSAQRKLKETPHEPAFVRLTPDEWESAIEVGDDGYAKLSDAAIAQEIGVSRQSVFYARTRLGIRSANDREERLGDVKCWSLTATKTEIDQVTGIAVLLGLSRSRYMIEISRDPRAIKAFAKTWRPE